MGVASLRRTSAVAAGVLAFVALTGCARGPDLHREALLDARYALERVSALAVEDASRRTPTEYERGVRDGLAWPKPRYQDQPDHQPGDDLPAWAWDGLVFDVRSRGLGGDHGHVDVGYAVSGQASTGSGFQSRIDRVYLCVRIDVEYAFDTADDGVPAVTPATCPETVDEYFGAADAVDLRAVTDAGR